MLTTVIGWLAAAAAIAVLARLRGKRGLLMLGACLLLVVLGVLAWNLAGCSKRTKVIEMTAARCCVIQL